MTFASSSVAEAAAEVAAFVVLLLAIFDSVPMDIILYRRTIRHVVVPSTCTVGFHLAVDPVTTLRYTVFPKTSITTLDKTGQNVVNRYLKNSNYVKSKPERRQ